LGERFLQHHFSNVFYNIASTPLLQHCFNTTFATLSSTTHFNIASVAPSFAASLLLLSGSKV
jgi:hypothetical protein